MFRGAGQTAANGSAMHYAEYSNRSAWRLACASSFPWSRQSCCAAPPAWHSPTTVQTR
ncbi:Proline racemase (fragment) [Cupriavidus taiwanensis]